MKRFTITIGIVLESIFTVKKNQLPIMSREEGGLKIARYFVGPQDSGLGNRYTLFIRITLKKHCQNHNFYLGPLDFVCVCVSKCLSVFVFLLVSCRLIEVSSCFITV